MAEAAFACNVASNLRGDNPDVLTHIYQDSINLIQWQRAENSALRHYAEFLTSDDCHFSLLRGRATATGAEQWLQQELPEHTDRQDFINDLVLLVDMFCTLFELPAVSLRLTVLKSVMCPKFHIDRVPCRLVTSYCGPGTEWLENYQVKRHKLGHNTQGKTDKAAGVFSHERFVQQVASQHILLMKGEGWEGNEGNGAVHRSPRSQPGDKRLLLTLDFSD